MRETNVSKVPSATATDHTFHNPSVQDSENELKFNNGGNITPPKGADFGVGEQVQSPKLFRNYISPLPQDEVSRADTAMAASSPPAELPAMAAIVGAARGSKVSSPLPAELHLAVHAHTNPHTG